MWYGPKFTTSVIGCIITSSRLFLFDFQIPKSNTSFTLFFCGGNSPCGTYMFTKPPTVLNIHKSTLHVYLILENRMPNQTNIYTQKYVSRKKKINTETFQNFRNQCSVTKHIIPLIHLTNYTYEWYCLKTLKLRLLKVQSQQGNLWDTWNMWKSMSNLASWQTVTVTDNDELE